MTATPSPPAAPSPCLPPQAAPPIDGRRLVSLPLEPGLTCLRGLSPRRLRFEVEYGRERGTCANSYLFDAGTTASGEPVPALLVHPPGATFTTPFLDCLGRLLDPAAPLDVVVGVVNPNRVLLLRRLARRWPGLRLIASNAGALVVQDLWDRQAPASGDADDDAPGLPLPPIEVIRGEHTREMGHGLRLRLIPAPTPRWPGGLIAFEETSGLLMSSKFFSAHVCVESFAEPTRHDTEADRRFFHDCLMAPMARQVEMVLDRIETLPIRTIAPAHGPAVDQSWRSLVADYRRWGRRQEQATASVALLYASAYGNTAAIADALARGLTGSGVRVESLNCEFAGPDQVLQAIRSCDGLLIGSPTLGGHAPTPIVSALGTVLAEGDRTRPVGVFGSFGWSGEAIDLLAGKLRDGGFHLAFDPIRVRFSPDAAMFARLEEQGAAMARLVLGRSGRIRRSASGGGVKESRSLPAQRALGRVVGSLCVLTVRRGSGSGALEGAQLVSWVSQAGFHPPAISLSVGQDLPLAETLPVGETFALNMLQAGSENRLAKPFLRPIPPAPAAMADLAPKAGPQGQPLLADALAWLEARVSQRVACGDHWLLVAEVLSGGVLDADGTTAVPQRRSGVPL
ncbi:flavoprotein [Cyanobium sp. Copco_Reservoir_LC18]|uniref:diflavin flavoprotein n=1 Tax=Cyanobium sp. Copco_Reservoir_LC18 TaxID=1328305 RepID=UPI001357AB7B|nr:diflavin flavoprotein [Cyanobium sp. Copco_Reservoir_LC18]KAF0652793.1 flavoprotein [Cyanobium sp. Copco_Reservoir_LC18]